MVSSICVPTKVRGAFIGAGMIIRAFKMYALMYGKHKYFWYNNSIAMKVIKLKLLVFIQIDAHYLVDVEPLSLSSCWCTNIGEMMIILSKMHGFEISALILE